MLDDFKNNSFYEYAINLKQYFHAYLFEVDDVEKNFPLILAFAKMIICNYHYKNNKKCLDCNICHLIDNNTYSDLKIVEPIGASIKKEQVLDLQKSLSLKSSNNTNQVYIIKEADKMNLSASNSLLKFIEEPEIGIYGILITTNRKQLLDTILSRCILISLKSSKEKEYEKYDIENLSNFLNIILNNKENTISYLNQDFFKYYKTRDDIINALNIMEVIIDYKIRKKYKTKQLLNNDFCDIIDSNLGDIINSKLINILEQIVIYKNKLISVMNLNLNLFMDRFIIDISEVLK